jgi:hypothetical protein
MATILKIHPSTKLRAGISNFTKRIMSTGVLYLESEI